MQRHSIYWNILVLHYSVVTWLYPCCEVSSARGNKTPQRQQHIRTPETRHQSNPPPQQVLPAPPSAQQVRSQQASPAADQSATMAKLFSAYDVCETSHHLQITHLDLHICDDIHAKDKGMRRVSHNAYHSSSPQAAALDIILRFYMLSLLTVTNKRITGGAMQLSFSSITLDYYPFHRAGLVWNILICCEISKIILMHPSHLSPPFFSVKTLIALISHINDQKLTEQCWVQTISIINAWFP